MIEKGSNFLCPNLVELGAKHSIPRTASILVFRKKAVFLSVQHTHTHTGFNSNPLHYAEKFNIVNECFIYWRIKARIEAQRRSSI